MATTVTEIDDANAAWTYSATGWTAASGQSATNYTSGTYHSNNTAGATAQVTATGRAFYLVTSLGSTNGTCSVTVDGKQVGTFNTYGYVSNPSFLMCLATGLVDTSHAITITIDGTGTVTIDSLLAVSGTPAVATPGVYVALGDSITYGYYATNTTLGGYAARCAALLQAALSRPVTLTNKGVPGDFLYAGGSGRGGMYRVLTDVLPSTPEFFSILYGANDYANTSADHARCAQALLRFAGDTLDTTTTKIAIGTLPFQNSSQTGTGGPSGFGTNAFGGFMAHGDNLAQAIRQIAATFPWCRVANIFDATDYEDFIADTVHSPHFNDEGHSLMALEFLRAFLGIAA